MSRSARAWILALAWAGLIFTATSISMPAVPTSGLPLDKAAHFGLYAGLGWLLHRALREAGPRSPGGTAAVWGAAVLFSVVDEYHQQWIFGREAAVGDWIADVAGLLAGTIALWWTARRGGPGRPAAPGGGGTDGSTDRPACREDTGNGTGQQAYATAGDPSSDPPARRPPGGSSPTARGPATPGTARREATHDGGGHAPNPARDDATGPRPERDDGARRGAETHRRE